MQLIPDWQMTPFTDLMVEYADDSSADLSCPDGYEPVLQRNFGGTNLACDCTVVSKTNYPNFGGQTFESQSCNSTLASYGCTTANAGYFVKMGRIPIFNDGSSTQEAMICGKTGGLPYQNVTLPNTSGQCPTGYTACGTGVVADYTVCYEDTDDCPITYIQFIETS